MIFLNDPISLHLIKIISMKKVFLAILVSGMIYSCEFKKQYQYGVTVDSTNAISVSELISNSPSEDLVVKGNISAVCQGEGCWLKLDAGNGEQVFVDWDKKFSVPRDIEGKTVFIHGFSYLDTTTVAELKQMQRDKGRPNEEIMLIDSPLIKVAIKADGLEIK